MPDNEIATGVPGSLTPEERAKSFFRLEHLRRVHDWEGMEERFAAEIKAALAEERSLFADHVRFLRIDNHPDREYMAGFNEACDLMESAIRARA